MPVDAVLSDITTLPVDVVVNAANSSLLGGGGVDGAIHRTAGPALLEECRRLGGCRTGEAKLTAGHRLPARHVIHTVGPVWHGGGSGEADALATCYRNALRLAAEHRLVTLAFPSISTGVYGYPFTDAAQIAVHTVRATLATLPTFEAVIFCCFADRDRQVYQRLLDETGD